jgi:acyl-ACP thioesterase
MSSWQIIVNRFPTLGDEITTGTWAYDFNTMYGYRNFIMRDSNNNICAYANSIWVFIDTEHNKPSKLTPEFATCYPIEDRYPMNYAPRKINVPTDIISRDPFLVVQSNIDTNNHVNNGQYIRMAEEYLPPSFVIRQMRADYRSSAVLGDTIIPKVSTTDNSCTVILSSLDDKPYAIVEFLSQLE